jgi:hypothetical protein
MIAEIPQERLKGVVAQRGSGSSHVAIIARALDIPCVMGALDLPLFAIDGRPLIVDGFLGQVFVNPSTHLVNHYQDLIEEEREFAEELKELKDLPSVTRDGRRVQLWVNIGLIGDISRSLDRGAEGIGRLVAQLHTMRRMSVSVAGMLHAGKEPVVEASIVKDIGTIWEQQLPQRVRDLAAFVEPDASNHEILDTVLPYAMKVAPKLTIQGGTTEVLRGIIARGLGLR